MKLAKRIKDFILDVLFPISCLVCRREYFWLCPKCEDKIEIQTVQVCPYCEKSVTEQGKLCPFCKNIFLRQNKTAPLDALISSAKYAGTISRLIHFFKYNFIRDLRVPLGKILTGAITKNGLPIPDLIVPVPLHPRRLRWRGFNQAELLAHYVGQNLAPGFDIPVFSNLLIRQKYTSAQMKIRSYGERKRNIAGAFSINSTSFSLQGKNILLIDDICTTGSTLFESAGILKKAGAKKVFAAVIARQELGEKSNNM